MKLDIYYRLHGTTKDDVKFERVQPPQRIKGRWMLKGHLWECDRCGCRINRAKPLKGNIWNYNFCPNCGADMRQGEEDEANDSVDM